MDENIKRAAVLVNGSFIQLDAALAEALINLNQLRALFAKRALTMKDFLRMYIFGQRLDI
jgi:hypothetical protein